MAMVDAMPVPDSRQKVDELFLFWLSEPSTQEMLRNELTKVCRYGGDGGNSGGGDSPNILDSLVQPPALTRSSSPNYRTPSPPLHLSNSPKSPRAKRRAKSPRRNLKYGPTSSAATEKAASDEVDYFPSAPAGAPLPAVEPASGRKAEKAGRTDAVTTVIRDAETKAERLQNENNTRGCPGEVIPRFFFPNGRAGESKESVELQLREAGKVFQQQSNGEVSMANFHLVVKVIFQLLGACTPLHHTLCQLHCIIIIEKGLVNFCQTTLVNICK